MKAPISAEKKIQRIVSPEKFFPPDIRLGNLLGNKPFIESLVSCVEILRESQFWSKDLVQHIQVERLKKLIGYISQHSQFWADYLKNHNFLPDSSQPLEMLRLLPVLNRRILLDWGDKICVLTPDRQENVITRYTSGTGGIPMKVVVDQTEYIIAGLAYRFRHPAFDGVSTVELLRRKFVVVLGLPGDRHLFLPDFTHQLFHPLVSSDLEHFSVRDAIYKKIREVGPAMLIGYASLVSKFAQGVADDKIALPLFAVRTSSEGIPLADRIFINQVLKAPVVNAISTNETRLIGFECPENMDKFHMNSERIILEVVDEKGIPVPDGQEGDFVVTVLDHTVTPIIRYAINDTGRIVPGNCPCGRTLPLFEFYGRRDSHLRLPSGRTVKVLYLHDTLREVDGLWAKAIQLQVRQESLDRVRLLILPKRPLSQREEANIRLSLIKLCFGEKIKIDIDYVENISAALGRKPQFFVPLNEG